MNVELTAEMVDALREAPELPGDLASALEAASSTSDGFDVPLSGDERMEMTEMCQWYIKKDPDTGELTERASLFNQIVDRLYAADED